MWCTVLACTDRQGFELLCFECFGEIASTEGCYTHTHTHTVYILDLLLLFVLIWPNQYKCTSLVQSTKLTSFYCVCKHACMCVCVCVHACVRVCVCVLVCVGAAFVASDLCWVFETKWSLLGLWNNIFVVSHTHAKTCYCKCVYNYECSQKHASSHVYFYLTCGNKEILFGWLIDSAESYLSFTMLWTQGYTFCHRC